MINDLFAAGAGILIAIAFVLGLIAGMLMPIPPKIRGHRNGNDSNNTSN